MRPSLRALRSCVLIGPLIVPTAASAATSAAAAPDPGPAVTAPVGVWPLEPEPEVVRPFEPPPGPYASGHRGVDLAAGPGQVVRSTLGGTVGFAGSIGGKPVVTVLHGDRRTTYEPVVATVERGQEVAAGEQLGRLVVTDSHCFPAACLHWGLIRDQEYLDPLTLVDPGPVRLLPLWRDQPVTLTRGWTPLLARWQRPVDAGP